MEIDELAREYESKSDEELLRLTLDRADLTSEANSALNIELSKRNIDRPEALEAFRQEEWRRKKDLEKNPGKLWVIHHYGVGESVSARLITPTTQTLRLSNLARRHSSSCSGFR